MGRRPRLEMHPASPLRSSESVREFLRRSLFASPGKGGVHGSVAQTSHRLVGPYDRLMRRRQRTDGSRRSPGMRRAICVRAKPASDFFTSSQLKGISSRRQSRRSAAWWPIRGADSPMSGGVARLMWNRCGWGRSLHCVQNTLQIGKPERFFQQRQWESRVTLIGEILASGQCDRADTECSTVSAQIHPLLRTQHQIRDEHIEGRSSDPYAGLDRIRARHHIVTEFGQDAGNKLTNGRVRLSQENTRHCPLDSYEASDIETLMV